MVKRRKGLAKRISKGQKRGKVSFRGPPKVKIVERSWKKAAPKVKNVEKASLKATLEDTPSERYL